MRRVFVLSIAIIGLIFAAGTAYATNVALFFNPTYVDTGPAPGGEATNLRDTLIALGYTVNTFTGITADAITTATVGQQVLMFPELEVRDLSPDLDLNASFSIGFFFFRKNLSLALPKFALRPALQLGEAGITRSLPGRS